MSNPALAAARLLEVEGLTVAIHGAQRVVRPVEGVSLSIEAGETFALLGESGCGKSLTALAIARLLPEAAAIAGGRVSLGGEELLALPESHMRQVRGGRIGMIFQEPATSLNPVMTIGAQIGEVLALHRNLKGEAARAETRRLLEEVGIPAAQERLNDYPFQFSGGMKQRVMIAMALAGEPELLIADEPTTALDVTIQAQVLDLLARLQAERGMAMLLITHDLGVVARMAHRVGLLYAGELIETGSREEFFASPLHPYAQRLFAALPDSAVRGRMLDALPGGVPSFDQGFTGCRFVSRCPRALERCQTVAPDWSVLEGRSVRCHLYGDGGETPQRRQAVGLAAETASPSLSSSPPVLEVSKLAVHFPMKKGLLRRTVGWVRAVDGVSLRLEPGRTLALVGESGCGKTTVGRAILQLTPPTEGEMTFDGAPLRFYDRAAVRGMRRAVQMVFQDPFASLNPRLCIGDILEEGMVSLGVGGGTDERRRVVDELLGRVGLLPEMRWRYPHEFSGGQRQRIAIARALAVSPRVIVCDEPTSALDVSVQAQLLNLMCELQRERGLAYLFITHNLAVVRYMADEVAVMYLGRIVEQGPTARVLEAPVHPYTRMLLAAVPRVDAGAGESTDMAKEKPGVAAEPPSPLAPPMGCHFHPRCEHVGDDCRTEFPSTREMGHGHTVRCHLAMA
ncbi:MAG: dipeptide ABC transporter ATP-binding protein [Betaproteobacteria bacterium]|nr:dipeptide ABC transporter ATP-binding protein [Betaproteobacteria bacterium]